MSRDDEDRRRELGERAKVSQDVEKQSPTKAVKRRAKDAVTRAKAQRGHEMKTGKFLKKNEPKKK